MNYDFDYDEQANDIDVLDMLERLKTEHEKRNAEKEKSHSRLTKTESNESDVYQDNQETSQDTPEIKPSDKEIINEAADTSASQNNIHSSSSVDDSEHPGKIKPEYDGKIASCLDCTLSSYEYLKRTLDRIWYTPTYKEDKKTVDRICEIKSSLSKIETYVDLLKKVNDYIDEGNVMNEELFFIISNIYLLDERFYKNYRAHAFDNNHYSGQGESIDKFLNILT